MTRTNLLAVQQSDHDPAVALVVGFWQEVRNDLAAWTEKHEAEYNALLYLHDAKSYARREYMRKQRQVVQDTVAWVEDEGAGYGGGMALWSGLVGVEPARIAGVLRASYPVAFRLFGKG